MRAFRIDLLLKNLKLFSWLFYPFWTRLWAFRTWSCCRITSSGPSWAFFWAMWLSRAHFLQFFASQIYFFWFNFLHSFLWGTPATIVLGWLLTRLPTPSFRLFWAIWSLLKAREVGHRLCFLSTPSQMFSWWSVSHWSCKGSCISIVYHSLWCSMHMQIVPRILTVTSRTVTSAMIASKLRSSWKIFNPRSSIIALTSCEMVVEDTCFETVLVPITTFFNEFLVSTHIFCVHTPVLSIIEVPCDY